MVASRNDLDKGDGGTKHESPKGFESKLVEKELS